MTNDYRENGVKFSMTTKGVWYCAEVAVSTDDVLKAIDTANTAMGKINKILGRRNRYRKPKEVEKDA